MIDITKSWAKTSLAAEMKKDAKPMAYEIELTTKQQIAELNEIADTINRALRNLPRKRSLRDSELAMTCAKYKRAAIAVQMAIDHLEKTS